MGRRRQTLHAARAGAALLLCGAGGLLLAMGATGASMRALKKPSEPPGRSTTTVTTTTTATVPTITTATVSTTTTVSSTTTAPSPPPAPPPAADIAVSTLDPAAGPVYAGTSVTYTNDVTNAGPDTATGVFLDIAAAGGRIVSSAPSSGSCTASDGLQCSLGSLASGSSAVVSVTYAPDTGSVALIADARAGADQVDWHTTNNLSHFQTTVLAGHAGAPVLMSAQAGTFAPPLVATGKGSTRTLATSLHIDEQSVMYVRVYDGKGGQVAMLPGSLVDYRPAERTHVVIPQTIAGARWLALRLRVAATKTHSYRVVLRAVGADGAAATAKVLFLS